MDFSLQTTLVASLVSLIVATIFVYVAARIVVDTSSILASIGTAFFGTLLAGLALTYIPGVLGLVAAAAAWALVAAAFFRTKWLKGAVIGLVAWVLWALALWAIDRVGLF